MPTTIAVCSRYAAHAEPNSVLPIPMHCRYVLQQTRIKTASDAFKHRDHAQSSWHVFFIFLPTGTVAMSKIPALIVVCWFSRHTTILCIIEHLTIKQATFAAGHQCITGRVEQTTYRTHWLALIPLSSMEPAQAERQLNLTGNYLGSPDA